MFELFLVVGAGRQILVWAMDPDEALRSAREGWPDIGDAQAIRTDPLAYEPLEIGLMRDLGKPG